MRGAESLNIGEGGYPHGPNAVYPGASQNWQVTEGRFEGYAPGGPSLAEHITTSPNTPYGGINTLADEVLRDAQIATVLEVVAAETADGLPGVKADADQVLTTGLQTEIKPITQQVGRVLLPRPAKLNLELIAGGDNSDGIVVIEDQTKP
jgi:hypothetical protein